MDITVDEVEGLPAHTYISIRFGETRKQAPFRTGEAISFPSTAQAEKLPKAYTVDVFRKVASKQVNIAGITALGGSIKHENLTIPSLEIQGSPITVSLTAALAQSKKTPSSPAETKKQEVAVKAKRYMEEKGVQTVLHEMFARLLEKLPNDPLAFMVDFLEQQREEAEEQELGQDRDFSCEPGLGSDPYPGYNDGQNLPDLTQHHSIMADILRKEPYMYENLRNETTALGVTFAQCIKSGVDCPGHELVKVAGAFAGDEESYDRFQEFFNPIIAALHTNWAPGSCHPSDGNPGKLTNARIDTTGDYAVSASIETRRNLRGIRHLTCCSSEERRKVEGIVTTVFEVPESELRGAYYPLRRSQSYLPKPDGMSQHQEERLRNAGMLFAEPDSRMRLSAGFGRDWPDARGIFVGEGAGLFLWCNEEDHLRFFARQHGIVDMKQLWGRVNQAMLDVGAVADRAGHPFSDSSRHGYTTACPSRLGAALRVTVSLKIPLLAAATDLAALCRSLDLQCSQEAGVGQETRWNVTSTDCLGISEVDLLNEVIEGCHQLVELEKRLAREEPIYDAMPGLGSEPFPGFSANKCPSRMPELMNHHSLMALVLKENPDIYNELRGKKTELGVTLAPCIKPGVDDKGHARVTSVGLVAGDEACYDLFRALFDPVIGRLRGGGAPQASHPVDAAPSKLEDIGAEGGAQVLSVRVEIRRNLKGLCLAPCMTKKERQEVERVLTLCVTSLGEKGEYLPLACSESYAPRPGGLAWAEQARLQDQELLFAEPSTPSRLAAGLGRDWPDARGAYLAEDQELSIWCNEEDHLRVVSAKQGSDLRGAYTRAYNCVEKLGTELQANSYGYMQDGRLGYLTVDPANLGTALRCSVAMRLPRLSARPDFTAECSALGVQAAWRYGAWEIVSGLGMGISEADQANAVIAGCRHLAQLEQQLDQGVAIEGKLKSQLAG